MLVADAAQVADSSTKLFQARIVRLVGQAAGLVW